MERFGMGNLSAVFGVFAVLLVLLLSSPTLCDAQNATDACKGVDCQKGECVATGDLFGFGFECQCDKGWTKFIPLIPFLGCGVPECNLNFTCSNSTESPLASPAPAPAPAPVSSGIQADPCVIPHLCGNGKCTTVPATGFLKLPSFKCDCYAGNSNIFNWTTGVCLPSCNLSGSCPNLGIPLSPVTAESPPASTDPNAGLTTPPPVPSQDSQQGKASRTVASFSTIGAILVLAISLWVTDAL